MSEESTSNDVGSFVVGLAVGALLGAAAALLFAPQSGEETRAQIQQRGIELRDQASAAYEDARHKVEETAQEARTRAEKLAAEARARAEELQSKGKAAIEEGSTRLQSVLGRKAESGPATPTAE